MDELEIDGKKYLSSRRAAKENKYHTDYIGQLIRAGKIAGKKVGRAWYVEESSLNAYLKAESAVPAQPMPSAPIAPVVMVRVEAPEPAPAAEEAIEEKEPAVEAAEEIVEKEIIPEAAPMIAEIAAEKEPDPEPAQRVHITLAEKAIPQKKNTLTYVEDEEPLLPVLGGRVRANADFVPRAAHRVPVEAVEEQAQEQKNEAREDEEAVIIENRGVLAMPSLARAGALALVAFFTLAFFAAGSALVVTSIQVKEGQPASVAYTIK